MNNASVWLIEGRGPDGPIYWSGRTPTAFVSAVEDAVRFVRQVDAERVRCCIVPEGQRWMCGAIEHEWVDRP